MNNSQPKPSTPFPKILFLIALALAVIAVAGGIYITGGPSYQRQVKFDEERITRLRQLSSAVEQYYTNHDQQLPTDLFEVERYMRTQLTASLDPHTTEDPETAKLFEYQADSKTDYRLCATFATANLETADSGYDQYSYSYSSGYFTGRHPKGRHCFAFKTPANRS